MITAVTLLLGPPVSLGLSLQHPAIPPPCLLTPGCAHWLQRPGGWGGGLRPGQSSPGVGVCVGMRRTTLGS